MNRLRQTYYWGAGQWYLSVLRSTNSFEKARATLEALLALPGGLCGRHSIGVYLEAYALAVSLARPGRNPECMDDCIEEALIAIYAEARAVTNAFSRWLKERFLDCVADNC